MKIRNVIHRGLRRFIERGDPSGLPAASVDKIGDIMSFLEDMEDPDELRSIATWKAHRLAGARKGTWSLTVTLNWRITFRIDQIQGGIIDLDYEDYL